jgi:hypothetical protein
VIITEKVDGTNALVDITEAQGIYLIPGETLAVVDGVSYIVRAGSRSRWLTPGADNYGFAAWVADNADELAKLGPGRHYGEWFGKGIQRNYGLEERRFALFNTSRWYDPRTARSNYDMFRSGSTPEQRSDAVTKFVEQLCSFLPGVEPIPTDVVTVVPVLHVGPIMIDGSYTVDETLGVLAGGSVIVPGYMRPEGVVVYHTASRAMFKVLVENDALPKGVAS